MLFASTSTTSEDYRSFKIFFPEFLAHAAVGLLLGAFVDRVFAVFTRLSKENLSKENDDSSSLVFRGLALALGIAQLLTSVLVLFALVHALPPHVYKRWQSTVPGLAFPSLFFGIQTQLFENARIVVDVDV